MRILASPGLGVRELNPYTWLLYSNMSAKVVDFSHRRAFLGRYDIAHFHWPEWDLNRSSSPIAARLRLQRELIAVDYMRRLGTKVFWTVHNLRAHERKFPALEEWFWDAFTARLDGFIALTEKGKIAAEERFPRLKRIPGFVVPHGHYRDEYQTCHNARSTLGIPSTATVVLFFGKLRTYKNTPELITIFRSIAREDLMLVVAGKPATIELGETIESVAAGDPHVLLDLDHISARKAAQYFDAADLVVLPYKEILNSGTAILALSMNKPVLVPNRGAMSELAEFVGPEWVRSYCGDLTASELVSALTWAKECKRSATAPLDELSWPSLSAKTMAAYSAVIG